MRQVSRRNALQLVCSLSAISLSGCTTILARDSSPLEERWTKSATGPLQFRPLIYNGSVYISDLSGRITSYDAETGNRVWRKFTPNDDRLITPVETDGNRVYAGNTRLHAYTLDGEHEWSSSTEQMRLQSRHGLSVGDSLVFSGISGGKFRAFDAESGETRWTETVSTADPPSSITSHSFVNGTIVLGTDDGTIIAVDASTGALEWSQDVGQEAYPIYEDGIVYVASNNLSALDATTGEVVWEERVNSRITSPLTIRDGTVFACLTNMNRIAAFDTETGTQQWSYTLERDDETFSHAPTPGNDAIYIGTRRGSGTDGDGRLRSFDFDGTERWTYAIDEGIQAPPAVANAMIYVASGDHLHAFEEES